MRLVLVFSVVLGWAVAGTACDDDTVDKSGGPIDTCGELCEQMPVDQDTIDCIGNYLAGKGYMTSDSACTDTNAVAACNICYDKIGVQDFDCDTAYASCF